MNLLEAYQRYIWGLIAMGDKLCLSRQLPLDIRELFKQYKSDVLAMLDIDGKAREIAFHPILPGEVYERQISPYSHIFIQLKEDGKWYAWRETFDARGRQVKGDSKNLLRTNRQSVRVKMLASNVNTFDMALTEVSKYVDYLRINREGI
jgi:hypothetical protein